MKKKRPRGLSVSTLANLGKVRHRIVAFLLHSTVLQYMFKEILSVDTLTAEAFRAMHTTAHGPTSNLWLHNKIPVHLNPSHVGGGHPATVFLATFICCQKETYRRTGDAALSVFVLYFHKTCPL